MCKYLKSSNSLNVQGIVNRHGGHLIQLYLFCCMGILRICYLGTALPIGEYAAVTLLVFFGLKAIKDAWDLPSAEAKTGESSNQESDEFTEAEELVKEKVNLSLLISIPIISTISLRHLFELI